MQILKRTTDSLTRELSAGDLKGIPAAIRTSNPNSRQRNVIVPALIGRLGAPSSGNGSG